MSILDWAKRHGISDLALAEIGTALTVLVTQGASTRLESDVQGELRVAASRRGDVLWRNNVGQAVINNCTVRFGLCNDSKKLNGEVKSADLIGIKRVLVTGSDVGRTIGQFYAREVKREGWKFHPNDAREAAQQRFLTAVTLMGGDAKFATGPGDL